MFSGSALLPAGDAPPARPLPRPAAPDIDDRELPPTRETPLRPTPATPPPEGKSSKRSSPSKPKPESLPDLGSEVAGFEVLATIGSGAFAKVYLARQNDLGGRLVVLKITTESAGETRVLSQLLHTNVVPIYSVHHVNGLTIACMPFLGTTTLADLLKEVRAHGLPDSGKSLVCTLQEQRSSRRSSRVPGSSHSRPGSDTALAASESSQLGAVPEHVPGTRVLLDKLEGLPYVDAILWLTQRLADGLAHAHERGILHRDLKPANILLTDEGQPMLLDFNLAEDTKVGVTAEAARQGGTLPYMSPEQLVAFQGIPRGVDARSDIYGLGVILYELLTGRFPFPSHSGPTRAAVDRMLQDRLAPPPKLRAFNKDVTPAVEAIVRHCLAPEPDQRYQSVRELQEDIRRQREHLPLKHVREPSWRERAGKWRKRHPRLASLTSVVAAAVVLSAGLLAALTARTERLSRLEASATLERFEQDLNAVQFLLARPTAERQRLQEPIDRGTSALRTYRVLDDAAWRERPAVRNLDSARQQQLVGDVRAMLILLARARATEAAAAPPGEQRAAALDQALAFNDRAAACGAAADTPRAWWGQRAELQALLGNDAEAARCRAEAEKAGGDDPQDAVLTARAHMAQGRFAAALPLLQQAARRLPQDVHVWFLRGRCHDGLGQDLEATACYTACIALRPQETQPHMQRGITYLRQRAYRLARADFDRVLAIEPRHHDALFNRALAHNGLKQPKEALADLDRAQQHGAPPTRVHFLRARLLEQLGDAAGAAREKAEGLKREPADEASWNVRGFARLATDPAAALADFRKALELNPRSLHALENIAHVLAEKERKPADALPYLTKAVELHPDHVPARTGRALLLARLEKRSDALAELKQALQKSRDACTLYRAAAICAQTSRVEPSDAKDALRHLSAALRQGYGLDLMPRDPDLAPLHTHAEYRRLAEAVKTLRQP